MTCLCFLFRLYQSDSSLFTVGRVYDFCFQNELHVRAHCLHALNTVYNDNIRSGALLLHTEKRATRCYVEC